MGALFNSVTKNIFTVSTDCHRTHRMIDYTNLHHHQCHRKLPLLTFNCLSYYGLLAILYDHMIMYVDLFGHSAVVFHVFMFLFRVFLCFTDSLCGCVFSAIFYRSIQLYSSQSV